MRPRRPGSRTHTWGRARSARVSTCTDEIAKGTCQLVDLLIAQRNALLHAPSGAGKTSLIQAGLMDLLREEDFAPTPPLRVNPHPPDDPQDPDPYVFSVRARPPRQANARPRSPAELTLTNVIKEAASRQPELTSPLLVLDQFEEILQIDPTDREGQQGFFAELGEALATTNAWALLSMREDSHIRSALDRFVRYIPGHLPRDLQARVFGAPTRRRTRSPESGQGEEGVTVRRRSRRSTFGAGSSARSKVPGRDQKEREVEAPYVSSGPSFKSCAGSSGSPSERRSRRRASSPALA